MYSGVQQTGAGAGGTIAPTWCEPASFHQPRGARRLFRTAAPTTLPSSTFPSTFPAAPARTTAASEHLGRNTFRGPGFHNFDIALIKDTPFGHRGNAEFGTVEFRAEFFNIFNIVNFGLPSNIVRGSGFGLISKTAGSSRQIQFSLKLIY